MRNFFNYVIIRTITRKKIDKRDREMKRERERKRVRGRELEKETEKRKKYENFKGAHHKRKEKSIVIAM